MLYRYDSSTTVVYAKWLRTTVTILLKMYFFLLLPYCSKTQDTLDFTWGRLKIYQIPIIYLTQFYLT